MKLILLPGNSVHNRAWLESAQEALGDLFDKSEALSYKHWISGGAIDWAHEASRLEALAQEPCVLVAKSAGVGVCLNALAKGTIRPEKCVFLGVPLDWSEKNGNALSPYFTNYTFPTLFIQQREDPYTTASELNKFLGRHSLTNYELKEIPGNDHRYDDFVTIRKLVRAFLNK